MHLPFHAPEGLQTTGRKEGVHNILQKVASTLPADQEASFKHHRELYTRAQGSSREELEVSLDSAGIPTTR